MLTNAGKLYLCATPIGNLEDITYRVIRTLNEVDIIAAEDTRHSIKLLNHYNIKTPMTSYHEYNKVEKARYLVEQIIAGKNIALITDAGTPAISDPGEEIVQQAYEAGVEVTSLPGACAAITALTLSGLSTRRFSFEAFLPNDKKEKRRVLDELKTDTRTLILYEAPHRITKTLNELLDELGNRTITIVRELTKRHETVWRTTISEAINAYKEQDARGEYVLIIDGKSYEEIDKEKRKQWEDLSIEEHVSLYIKQGLDKKEAMKSAAKDRGISKRVIYQSMIREEPE